MFNEFQEWNDEIYRFEIDSSPQVYGIYNKIYSEEIKSFYSIENPKFFRFDRSSYNYIEAPDEALLNRLFAIPVSTKEKKILVIGNREYKAYDAVERLSGDCFFNFNPKKVNVFKKIEGVNFKMLNECASMHNSIYNMVLLQTVGDMQRRKQNGILKNSGQYENFDRGDSFISLLDQFFKCENEDILMCSSQSNKGILRDYLNRFKDIYDYSSKMLQINDNNEFIDKLSKHGMEELDKITINQYMEDAIDFWNLRKQIIDKKI